MSSESGVSFVLRTWAAIWPAARLAGEGVGIGASPALAPGPALALTLLPPFSALCPQSVEGGGSKYKRKGIISVWSEATVLPRILLFFQDLHFIQRAVL